MPEELDEVERKIRQLEIEREAVKREKDHQKIDKIQEELANLSNVDSSQFYSDIQCPVLILRATNGMLAADDLLLPEDVIQRMCREIPHAERADITGTNHYSIVFGRNGERDGVIREFLKK